MHRLSFSRQTRCLLLIFLSFLWTSAGYLSWLYRLLELPVGVDVELVSEVICYLLQALGLLLFALSVRAKPAFAGTPSFAAVVAADLLFLCLAVLLPSAAAVLICGGLMNLLHGLVAGFYLHRLALCVDWDRRALTFGLGYGLASLAAWLLSLFFGGRFLRSGYVLLVYVALAALSLAPVLREPSAPTGEAHSDGEPVSAGTLALAALTVLLLSLVKGLGFSFPSADISQGIDLELSRVFYAVGLILAGLISDKERRYGAIFCVSALGIPFLMIMLTDQIGSSVLLWILSYLLFGFFSVFRVVLFSDVSRKGAGLLWLSGFGLLFGRVGDALGTLGCIVLTPLALIVTAVAVFTVTVVVFFLLYQRIYLPAPIREPTEQERFERFATEHDLSTREREILQLILDGRSTQEIANELFVTTSTVKFHIHNLLKKAHCANRIDLVAQYRMH